MDRTKPSEIIRHVFDRTRRNIEMARIGQRWAVGSTKAYLDMLNRMAGNRPATQTVEQPEPIPIEEKKNRSRFLLGVLAVAMISTSTYCILRRRR